MKLFPIDLFFETSFSAWMLKLFSCTMRMAEKMLGTIITSKMNAIARWDRRWRIPSTSSSITRGKRRYLVVRKVASAMKMLLMRNRYNAPSI